MALDSLLSKLKTAISHTFDSPKPTLLSSHHPNKPHSYNKRTNVGVLAFEISGLMSKLLHLWQSLSDKNMARLRNESILLEGVRKIVSNDDVFLLGLACAELTENLNLIAKSISRLSKRCEDSNLRSFDRLVYEFSDTGRDLHNWVLSWKEMESRNKKIDRFVTLTATLRKEMDELVALETSLRKYKKSCNSNNNDHEKLIDIQHKISWKKQEVKCLKERSLWNRSFDTVTSILAKSVFTVLARIKLVFGIGHGHPSSLPRCLSASAAVYPSENPPASCNLRISNASFHDLDPMNKVHYLPSNFAKEEVQVKDWKMSCEFFELNSELLSPPASTLGASALALHYANVIIVMEKMIRSPHLVGVDARDDLYAMLPNSIRLSLRCRLRGVGIAASDPMLAADWKDALGRILGWLSPLAHNMMKWQSERSFEHHNLVPKTNVLLLQTLYFANKEKAEAAITELLVGLNYIWRYERQMNAKALFECFNIK